MYSLYLKERIVRLYKSYERAGIIHDLPRSGRPRELSTATHAQIDNWLKENNCQIFLSNIDITDLVELLLI